MLPALVTHAARAALVPLLEELYRSIVLRRKVLEALNGRKKDPLPRALLKLHGMKGLQADMRLEAHVYKKKTFKTKQEKLDYLRFVNLGNAATNENWDPRFRFSARARAAEISLVRKCAHKAWSWGAQVGRGKMGRMVPLQEKFHGGVFKGV